MHGAYLRMVDLYTRRDLHALVIIIVLFYVTGLYNYIAVDVPVYLSVKTAY